MKTFLAALLAVVVGGILSGIVSILIFAGVASSFGPRRVAPVKDAVLRIDFAAGVTDEPDNAPFHTMGLVDGVEVNKANSLLQVLGAIEGASYDDNIEGIYINVTGGSISLANIEEVRAALLKFREESGKFVIAYSDTYSQTGYYFASVADRVFVHPEGGVNWQGLASQVMFYKGMLEKLGVDVEILRHGSFKSAVEPFMLEKMSAESRTQTDKLLGSVWGMLLDDVSAARGIERQTLVACADDLALADAEDAVRHGLIDGMLYPDQVEELLSRLVAAGGASIDRELEYVMQREADHLAGAETSEHGHDDVNLVDLCDYIAMASGQHGGMLARGDNRIAVIYIDGSIVDGVGAAGSIGGAEVAAKLAHMRRDEQVKGVVVRVNSPGGSAMASDIMWREMELLRREKPLVVSMGGYAASGGYWVSCPADLILADRSTLTGSIGVFGLLPNAGKALKDKLGITVDVASTNRHADMGSLFRPLDATERNFLQNGIEQVYRTFVGHVAAGRNLSVERVDEIGGGRVWSGADALEIGLVDGIGGLTEAIGLCADRAGVAESFEIEEVVDGPDTFSALLRALSSSARAEAALSSELGEAFVQYRNLRDILVQPGVQARMPYEIEIR